MRVNNGKSALASQMAAGSSRAVEVADVVCQFGRIRARDGVSLRVMPGTVVGVVGPNGAGKTTLIDVICGLVRPARGTVHVLGEDVAGDTRALRARIGVLPQETALYDEVTAWQNLRFAAALYGVPHADARIAEVLELVGLRARARDVVRGFSGGMQRRLAIARALLHDPPLLILDQPTLGVDVEADRKSTRLNSSHGYISYAVFCLKTKKTLREPTECACHENCRNALDYERESDIPCVVCCEVDFYQRADLVQSVPE